MGGDFCLMKNIVVIKSYQSGISLWLDSECDFCELLDEIIFKFSESRTFFGNARMALSIEGRKLTDSEQLKIVEAIQTCTNLEIICLVGKDEDKEQNFVKAIEKVNQHLYQNDAGGQFYRGTLKNNQMIETESSIVILGDVHPGSAVVSAHNIIVLGGLYGEAYAGGNGEEGHFVVALEMSPQKLTIGDFRYIGSKQGKWNYRPKVHPQIAYVYKSQIVMEPLTKELLSAF